MQDPPQPEVLIPYTMTGAFERGILVMTAGEPGALLNSVRKEIWAVDRGVALSDIGTLNDYLKRFTYASPRFSLVLLTAIDLGSKEWALHNLSAPRAAENRPAVCEPDAHGRSAYQRRPDEPRP